MHTKPAALGSLDQLPLPGKSLRNPLVDRALFQVRRVVNAIVSEYGKPAVIRVELARDLKLNAKQRSQAIETQKKNESDNNKAAEALREYGIANPSRADKLKYRLWLECQRECPYTGRSISMDELFGPTPQFDIEHIIPYSRCLNDSYMNKVLCYKSENDQKGNRTPWEAYHSDEVRYEAILQRAKRLPYRKFKRFAKDSLSGFDDFVSQQLNETRYIARETVEYLKLLGVAVESVKGGTTALLRHAWGLDGLLGERGLKNRLDHRHHAVDALVIALTDRSAVQRLSRYAALSSGRLRIEGYPEPVANLRQQAKNVIEAIVVSHKAKRRVRGPLHEATLYGITGEKAASGVPTIVLRRQLKLLKEKDLHHIRDACIRKLALERYLSCGQSIKAAFDDPDNPFGRISKKGEFIPIRKVRVTEAR